MYEIPGPSKQHSNHSMGISDSYASINDIQPLQLQLSNISGRDILHNSQGMMMVQHLWTWTMWLYADFLEIATFMGKGVIGLLNVGYRLRSHS